MPSKSFYDTEAKLIESEQRYKWQFYRVLVLEKQAGVKPNGKPNGSAGEPDLPPPSDPHPN